MHNLLDIVNRPESFRDRVVDRGSSVSEWMSYTRLDSGDIYISLLGLFTAYLSWLSNHRLLPYQATPEQLAQALVGAGIEVYDKGFDLSFSVNCTFPTLNHISSPRSGTAIFGLRKKLQKSSARSYIDYDYLPKLSAYEAMWLSKFTEEYYNNRFYNDETDLHSDQDTKRALYRDSVNRHRSIDSPARGKMTVPLERRYYNQAENSRFSSEDWCLAGEDPESTIIEYIDDCYGE